MPQMIAWDHLRIYSRAGNFKQLQYSIVNAVTGIGIGCYRSTKGVAPSSVLGDRWRVVVGGKKGYLE